MNHKRAGLAIVVLAAIVVLSGVAATPNLVSEGHDRSVVLANDREQTISVTVTIEHQFTEMYQETHTVAADSEVEVAKLAPNPLHIGHSSVTVSASNPGGEQATIQVHIGECYGGPASFVYLPDGELNTIPASTVC